MTINKLPLIRLPATANKTATFSLITLFALLPTLAFAHPGHDILTSEGSFLSSALSGLMHPLTGLDHLMLALGMGVLFTQMNRFKKGLVSLSIGLMTGFALSLSFNLNNLYIEGGIILSIVLLTAALMSRHFNPALNESSSTSINKSYNLAIMGFGALAMFHGAAHALEVPANSITTGFFIGMIISMIALYSVGNATAKYLSKHVQNSLIVQRLLAVVGLCAVLIS